MEIVAGRCICTVSKKAGEHQFIEESKKFECTVSKKFIEEMYGLLKEGEDGEKEIGKVPKRLRKTRTRLPTPRAQKDAIGAVRGHANASDASKAEP